MRGADVALSVRILERNAFGEFQPLDGFERRVELGAERLAPCVEQRALLVVVGYREDRLEFFGSAAHRHAVVLRESGLENLVEPVRARDVGAGVNLRIGEVGQRAVVRIGDRLGPYVAELLCVEHRRQIHRPFESERYVHIDARLAGFGLAGGDQHDAARSHRSAVDSGRGGVFQDRDGLDVLDHVGSIGYAVHHDQHAVARRRTVVSAVGSLIVALRSAAADRERGLLHRVARLHHGHARHAALQQRSQVRGAAACGIVHLDRRHGHREVLLALRAVADRHDLADHRRLLFEGHVDLRAIHHLDPLRLVTDIREFEGGVPADGNPIRSVGGGRHAVGRSRLDHRGADQRILARVGQTPRNRDAFLRPDRKHE